MKLIIPSRIASLGYVVTEMKQLITQLDGKWIVQQMKYKIWPYWQMLDV